MKTCRRNFPSKPIITNTDTCICQGLCLMREFRLKHAEKKCSFEDVPGSTYKTEDFVTGSSYDGEWFRGKGMHGHGVYTFRNGVVYEGAFEDGHMHGKGELRYQTAVGKVVIRGWWKKDTNIVRKIIFDGSVVYKEEDWEYCRMPDRRYPVEFEAGLQPAGNSYLTSYKPAIKIPQGCYDSGDGIYEPVGKMVYTYDLSKGIRRPSVQEQKWIVENCRYGNNVPLGPRKDLYETFLEPTLKLAPEPLPKITTKTAKRRMKYKTSKPKTVSSGTGSGFLF
ncbi:hypothetical protein PYW08_003373 [Mythimna loreyi]|uniref:Uncharacterized protein n=1 Tax=Mythimna loreyi TaxID=667449 RepID=A0ACC2QT80_9NEOP|nr:hypothetical protein PYW08_003373 [Mythimna loreyi]